MAKPIWCMKPKPCDFDEASAYCPHRECRLNLIECAKQKESNDPICQESVFEQRFTTRQLKVTLPRIKERSE